MTIDISPSINLEKRVFDARPDTVDFRDRMYVPTLVEVPTYIDLEDYQSYGVPVLDQGSEGACTGYALASVAGYLLRRRKVVPDSTLVSARMFYEMAKRYDEWPGEDYSGSSARGAMKGWHKHGVCSAELWNNKLELQDSMLTYQRAADAARRPLGAYFRVNHKELVSMHSALAEVGILFVTAWTHPLWLSPDENGCIPYEKDLSIIGGHAFAIVAYDERGFWIQNSWGTGWGKGGFARICYDDWLTNGLDVWAARLGVPIRLRLSDPEAFKDEPDEIVTKSKFYSDLRPHIISLGEGGKLGKGGTYSSEEASVAEIFESDIPRVTKDWKKQRLFLYAPGGLVNTDTLVQRIADYRAALLQVQIYPLAFIWQTDLWAAVTNVLQEAFRSRCSDGPLTNNLDFMLDRLDDTLEPLVRSLRGKIQWDTIKENAYQATNSPQGGLRIMLRYLADWVRNNQDAEIHLVSHSAGSILFGPMARLLTAPVDSEPDTDEGGQGYGIPLSSCTFWAPSITIEEFKQTYLPGIRRGAIKNFALYTLIDQAEQNDNCAKIYNKSLLYLISNAIENRRSEPLLGMEKFVRQDKELTTVFDERKGDWVRAPNNALISWWTSSARHHGDFDDDELTLRSTVMRILQSKEELPPFDFQRSVDSLRERRARLSNIIG